MTHGLQSATLGFLSDIVVERLEPDICRLLARFDLARFDPALYPAMHIDTPPRFASMVPKRQAEFLAGRMLVSEAQTLLELPVVPIAISANRAPIWPVGSVGSITHSDTHVAVILAKDDRRAVGIDLQPVAQGDALQAILSRCLSQSERAQVDGDALLATQIFSAKETLYKALYPRVNAFFGFDAAEWVGPSRKETMVLRLTRRLHGTAKIDQTYEVSVTPWADHVLTQLIF